MKNAGFFSKISASRVLLGVILINLLIGLFLASDYGRSVDERHDEARGRVALRAYALDFEAAYAGYQDLGFERQYGTAMATIFVLTEEKLAPVLDLPFGVVTHYMYFVTFQIAVYFLFKLAKQFFDPWVALGTALLFYCIPPVC